MDESFQTVYQRLEARMKALADDDRTVFVPNPVPAAPVDYLFVCMEPSLGRWARSAVDARARLDEGFKNFLESVETSIFHYCIRHYLCGSTERYHLTDLSKGAMLVEDAGIARIQRYDRWYPLLQDEIELVASKDAMIIGVGGEVYRYLNEKSSGERVSGRILRTVMHYSDQAGRARSKGISGHEQEFEAFKNSVTLEDVRATAEDVIKDACVPPKIKERVLLRLKENCLTLSRQRLMFNYKMRFESLRNEKSRFKT
ncbi:MAG TPA: hypothetical protein VGH16_05610 [Candidatus Binatia bacterium]|jgi:hypothetical protein